MRTDELDFNLPPELIAQEPSPERTASRLLHYRRDDHSITHRHFAELPSLLRKGDLLVLNDTKVLPARFVLRKETGGRVEGLFLNETEPGIWNVLLKNLGNPRGALLHFEEEPALAANVAAVCEGGEYELTIASAEPATRILDRIGRMPLPPYIRRKKGHDPRDESDRQRYQTVYAQSAGSVAAPTAGLHFTPALFDALDAAGIERSMVTLHVGLGTFKPVTADVLETHKMHLESYEIGESTAAALNRAKAEGRRIIAVGTTSARVLESQPADRPFQAKTAQTGIFIYPPYSWKHVSGLITNFHLPRSTLIALVAAMVGLETQRAIYQAAIARKYRFFSFGDAMWIE